MTGGAGLAAPLLVIAAASGPVATVEDLAAALQACFRPPDRMAGSQVVVRFTLDGRGALQGRPRIVGSTSLVSESDRRALASAVLDALRRCTPLPLSPSFAATIAGRPLTLRLLGGARPQAI